MVISIPKLTDAEINKLVDIALNRASALMNGAGMSLTKEEVDQAFLKYHKSKIAARKKYFKQQQHSASGDADQGEPELNEEDEDDEEATGEMEDADEGMEADEEHPGLYERGEEARVCTLLCSFSSYLAVFCCLIFGFWTLFLSRCAACATPSYIGTNRCREKFVNQVALVFLRRQTMSFRLLTMR